MFKVARTPSSIIKASVCWSSSGMILTAKSPYENQWWIFDWSIYLNWRIYKIVNSVSLLEESMCYTMVTVIILLKMLNKCLVTMSAHGNQIYWLFSGRTTPPVSHDALSQKASMWYLLEVQGALGNTSLVMQLLWFCEGHWKYRGTNTTVSQSIKHFNYTGKTPDCLWADAMKYYLDTPWRIKS